MAEPPDHLDLRVGEEYSIELPGLGTAGFLWEDHIEGPPGVVQVTWQRGFPPGTAAPAVGASASETAILHAVGPGDVTVRLLQRRPWAADVPPHREHVVVVHVVPAE